MTTQTVDEIAARNTLADHIFGEQLCSADGLHIRADQAVAAMLAFAQQARLEGEAAGMEKAARYVEGHGGTIPGASVFAPLVSGNNMPCMSGDARDRLHPNKRREFDEATRNLAAAIRNTGATK